MKILTQADADKLRGVVEQVVSLSEDSLFIPTFRKAWNLIFGGKYRDFWFKGGRASFKSSFIAIVIVIGMMAGAKKAAEALKRGDRKYKRFLSHAVIYRKYGVDIHDSTYETIHWVVEELLGYGKLWWFAKSGRRAVFLPTGQQILFRGLDDAQKQKSIKAPFGWFKFLWFEEMTEYAGMEEIRSVRQSVQRGGHHFITLCSYNPPPSRTDWLNAEAEKPTEGRAVFHSSFLDAAKYRPEWLGEEFFSDAAALLETDERAFRHEYLGDITGTGSEIFPNLKIRRITQQERDNFRMRRYGLDFGFENDPSALMLCAYDHSHKTIYIYGEWVKHGQFEEGIFDAIKRFGIENNVIIADSAESRAIARLQALGARRMTKCFKRANFPEEGLVWMRSRTQIVIDPVDCPRAVDEFTHYEYEKLKDGTKRNEYPDRNNHTIDAVRYALENDIRYGDAPRQF